MDEVKVFMENIQNKALDKALNTNLDLASGDNERQKVLDQFSRVSARLVAHRDWDR